MATVIKTIPQGMRTLVVLIEDGRVEWWVCPCEVVKQLPSYVPITELFKLGCIRALAANGNRL